MTSGTPGLPAPGLPAPDLLAPGLDGTAPYGITTGPDGALWWVEIAAGRIGRITTGGEISGFPLPDPAARPHAIAADPTVTAAGSPSGAPGASVMSRPTGPSATRGCPLRAPSRTDWP